VQLELPLLLAPSPAPAGTLRYLQLGSEIVGYRFRRARRRSIGLAIDADGLRVSAPNHAAMADVEAFIREKSRWVLQKLAQWRSTPRAPLLTWRAGEAIALQGVPAILEFARDRKDICLQDGRLILGAASNESPAALRTRAIAWIKQLAYAVLTERLAHYASRLGVATPSLALSSARTRWGLCHADGRVRLNWRLIHLPPQLADYVVAHELAHLREMNHSARFWKVVGTLYPDYRQARIALRRCHHQLPAL